jgi:UDP-glucose 4-epimerase
MHFAAYSIVGESARDPLKYYKNNLTGAITLLEKMIEYNVRNFVFSSTAAVYGNPKKTPILESTETNPANPYGETKFAIEKMLKWCEAAHNFHFISLRYFNACGADEGGRLGENHNPETHLIPIILKNILSGNHEARIFGADYDTPDGTCVRDYIHVSDLASAHLLALEKLENSGESAIYNLGTGRGFSVREIIKAAETVTGAKIKIIETTRRTGDPAILVASNEKAARELLFVPKITSIEKMLKTAWKWHKNHLSGFDA